MNRDTLTERQMRRMEWRVSRFRRFGLSLEQAERIADRLADRDFDRDDRRMCIECASYAQDRSCLAARRGLLHGVVRPIEPIPTILHRCHRFTFATPA